MSPELDPRKEFKELAGRAAALAGDLKKRHPEALVLSARARKPGPAPASAPALALQTKAGAAVPQALADPRPPFAADLESFERQIEACQRCGLGKSRKRFVFGEGNLKAELVFLGDAPGAEEDQQGRPFAGAAGQLLTRIIAAIGMKREDVFIMNVLKCRPPMNRDPELSEVEACRPFYEHQLALIKPKAICALGRHAAQALLGTEEGIAKLRGRFFEWKGIPVLPTFHPAALLRDESLKRQVWDDMKLLLKKLEEKQA